MKKFLAVLIGGLPLWALCLCGLIFDTTDFLIALLFMGAMAGCAWAGFALWDRAS